MKARWRDHASIRQLTRGAAPGIRKSAIAQRVSPHDHELHNVRVQPGLGCAVLVNTEIY